MSLLRSGCVLAALLCSLLTGVAVAETGAATVPVTGALEILQPDEPFAGLTRGEWDARWWQWAVSMPGEINPNFDASGERCGYGQSGPMFFLPGNVVGEGSAEITCVVAAGTAIYVNVAGTECSTVEAPPFFGRTEGELRACANATLDELPESQAHIDGQAVAELEAYRTESPPFTLTFADDNIFGVEAGVAQSVSAAYSLIIAPPPPGEYEIATSGALGATTATVIVEAPHVIDAAATAAGWERTVPGGDCACADGSEFSFWVRPADPARVVLFLEGGGACFDAVTCVFTNADTYYDWNISALDDPGARSGMGIFDASRADNPFADYTFVYVPYCTGDFHLGDATTEYSPELTVQHNGWVNGTAAMSYLAEHFPDAAEVVVVGESAGGIAAPVYGGLVSDLLPEAHVTVLADSSGALPESPELNTRSNEVWGTFETMPPWDVNAALTAEEWGFQRFWVQAGLHDPKIVMARFDYAYDTVQTQAMQRAGLDTSDLGATMLANEAAIEQTGVVQHSFMAPGTGHVVVGRNDFYETAVNGVALVEWVTVVISGANDADVTCDECGGQ
jgi:hypothetical protein